LVKYGHGSTGEVIKCATIDWEFSGLHNVNNAMAAVAAAHHIGVDVATACEALMEFKGVKRRLELRGEVEGIKVYDDFAHHPTAIESTLKGMAAKLEAEYSGARLIAVIEPRSNTMKLGIHQKDLVLAVQAADMVVWQKPDQSGLDINSLVADSEVPAYAFTEVDQIVDFLKENGKVGDHIVVMSNGGFGGIHEKLLMDLGKTPHSMRGKS
jgi:UDP-N-acetylmuramate: L-alanyl-gamma-D-glutamyl-meso-diaminopimelate ligase